MMYKDNYGVYETTFTYKEPDNNHTYEMRKYVNSKKIKSLGGMYAIFCQETEQIIFRKSEYLRDKSYDKFVRESTGVVLEKVEEKKESTIYYLPGKIDRSKLSEEEFTLLRALIKKGLVTD